MDPDPDPTLAKNMDPDPDPTFVKYMDPDPDPDPTLAKIMDPDPDPDPTWAKIMDPDPDPTFPKKYGSDRIRIRIRNTAYHNPGQPAFVISKGQRIGNLYAFLQ